mmetsp:Transcript_16152/g.62989  ORF Transcript_16152/g.62989 Transcript_16152/m.62989 type:complete len:591 (-) Transcript_16152:461-2233(-)
MVTDTVSAGRQGRLRAHRCSPVEPEEACKVTSHPADALFLVHRGLAEAVVHVGSAGTHVLHEVAEYLLHVGEGRLTAKEHVAHDVHAKGHAVLLNGLLLALAVGWHAHGQELARQRSDDAFALVQGLHQARRREYFEYSLECLKLVICRHGVEVLGRVQEALEERRVEEAVLMQERPPLQDALPVNRVCAMRRVVPGPDVGEPDLHHLEERSVRLVEWPLVERELEKVVEGPLHSDECGREHGRRRGRVVAHTSAAEAVLFLGDITRQPRVAHEVENVLLDGGQAEFREHNELECFLPPSRAIQEAAHGDVLVRCLVLHVLGRGLVCTQPELHHELQEGARVLDALLQLPSLVVVASVELPRLKVLDEHGLGGEEVAEVAAEEVDVWRRVLGLFGARPLIEVLFRRTDSVHSVSSELRSHGAAHTVAEARGLRQRRREVARLRAAPSHRREVSEVEEVVLEEVQLQLEVQHLTAVEGRVQRHADGVGLLVGAHVHDHLHASHEQLREALDLLLIQQPPHWGREVLQREGKLRGGCVVRAREDNATQRLVPRPLRFRGGRVATQQLGEGAVARHSSATRRQAGPRGVKRVG